MTEKTIVSSVDEEIWRKFKSTAVFHGFTLKGALAHALKQWTERNAPPRQAPS